MSRLQPNQKVIVAAVYVSSMLMNSLDSTIVNVALATLGRQFNVPPSQIEAVVISYLVSLAIFIPASGWLGDRFGTKRIFLIALGLFTTASALCGLAQSINQLILFRIMQGVGGGMLTPVGMAMLWRTYPPQERMQVARILMFATIIGPASGPVLGGLLINTFSWRWIFYVNVPVGVTAFLIGVFFLHEHREPTAGGFDLAGFCLAGAGFASLMYALSEGPSHGWGSPEILIPAVASVILLTVFTIVELRIPNPMVQLRLFANRLFRTTLTTSLFASAGFVGVLFLTPLFLQEVRGASALASGLTTFPEALGVVCSTQLVARLYPRIGPRRLMFGGLLGVATTIALLSRISQDTSPWVVRLLMFLIGVGMAYVFLPNQAASLATIPRAATGRATTLFSAQRQLGAALGVAVLSSVLAALGPTRTDASGVVDSNLAAYHAAFLAAAGLSLTAAVLALRVPDRDAAATMRARVVKEAPAEQSREPVVVDVG